MFFVFSKLLAFSIKPHIWVLVLFLLGAWQLWRKSETPNAIRKAKRFFGLAFVVGYITGNHALVNEMYIWWEEPPTEISLDEMEDPPKTAVILGGYSRYDISSGRFSLSESGDRFMVGLQGLVTDKFDRVILTGGNSNVLDRELFEAGLAAQYLNEFGVTNDKIIIDNKARNTFENAVITKEILDSLEIEEPVLLVTSAFHMYRSKMCFDKAGVNYIAYPAHIRANRVRKYNWEALVIPGPGAMESFYRLMHEILGVIAYKASGKI